MIFSRSVLEIGLFGARVWAVSIIPHCLDQSTRSVVYKLG